MSVWSKTKEFFAWFFNDVPRSPVMPPMDGALPEQPVVEEKLKKVKVPVKKKVAKKPKSKTKRKTSSKKK